ncbi:MAG TPA: MBOAT family O-acyltransferase [Candidatus Dormibacteraeota bacterium]|nr:MBOAT family O-acyltransferase [Candidatus Dormibacteraeota bacterium]
MLFNSYGFIYGFLPVAALLFFVLAASGRATLAAGWLGLASVFFYGCWNPRYVLLLLASIAVNYVMARGILRLRDGRRPRDGRLLLTAAIAFNLGLLAYYKYANFFADTVSALTGAGWHLEHIVLPIGISFFTFTQIAYLADTYQGKARESSPVHYLLFVSYFPHLVAGPILHHSEMMPQFADRRTYRFDATNFTIGAVLFLIGLFKKVVLADGVQPFVGPVFDAGPSFQPTLVDAWLGALAYAVQIYFDFSGYSDMAIGLSKLFNVDLPLNFDSPYKAHDIIDFWRRWHMTLSRFLRDYLYIPLGGNRLGRTRRYLNLMATMLLGGLWHGAGWTFVVWGGLHGLYLACNHAWRAFRADVPGHDPERHTITGRVAGTALTFLAVVAAWVFFRAPSLPAALNILGAMAGLHGVAPSLDPAVSGGARRIAWIAALLAMAWGLPNSQQVVARLKATLSGASGPSYSWSALGALSVLISLLAMINGSRGASEFIYFNF